jgi:hypothetical protein
MISCELLELRCHGSNVKSAINCVFAENIINRTVPRSIH